MKLIVEIFIQLFERLRLSHNIGITVRVFFTRKRSKSECSSSGIRKEYRQMPSLAR